MSFGVCATVRRMISVLTDGRYVSERDAGWWRDRQQIHASAANRTESIKSDMQDASAALTEEAQKARDSVGVRNERTDAQIEANDRARLALNHLVSRLRELSHHG